ncbi:hypothetical protein KIH87_10535 [Paraneptunicella aestuarii]|uniref:hypothetical protein n=1 Tax=Paraneptunicella aestuarii TaxID=2831148 RepID=UPI001E4038B5|nr:hypothetical protein [Paraneptunicella aestuarii]UAA37185.1 hypothetical protein KIH87_10535 [Paraneptunicella aestuarii]
MSSKSDQKYKEEYGSNLFLHIFNDALNIPQKHAIAHYLKSLIDSPHYSITIEFKKELDKINFACDEIISVSAPSNQNPVEIHEIYNWLLKKQWLREYHATAFVCCELKSYSYRKPRFDHYKILVLCSAIRLAEIGDNDSPLNKVFNELRQLGLGKRDDVARTLPNPEDFPLDVLIDRLDILRQDETKSNRVQRSLDGYYVAFKNAYDKKTGRIKKGNRGPRKKYRLHIQTEIENEPDNDFDVFQVRELNRQRSKSIEEWENEEKSTSAEDLATYAVVALNQDTARELKENQVKAKQVIQSIQRKKQFLPCDFQSLTSHEIRILSHSILSADKTSDFEPALAFLLLSLLTGRAPEEIAKQSKGQHRLFYHDDSGLNLKIKHITATFAQEQEVSHIIRPVDKSVTIRLPNIVTEAQLKSGEIDSDIVKKWLSELNKKYGTRLAISRICQQINAFQRQNNLDSVIADLITGVNDIKTTGLPYSHITQQQIQSFIDQFSNWIQDITNNEKWIITTEDENKESEPTLAIGSPLYLKETEIISCNRQHIQHLNELRTKGTRYVIAFHNQYVLYIYRLITLASGYRPVVGTGGRIQDICLGSGKYWISDKERREGLAARVIVLPEIAIQQIKMYLAHLDALHFFACNQLPVLASHIQQVHAGDHTDDNTGESDLLFFIENDDITPLSPKSLKPYLADQFPVAINWHRHFLRSFLMTKEDISPALIDCFMGHEEMGQEGFGRFSGFSYGDFKRISETLQTLLCSLKFEVVKGCKIH